jgi:hypothetical protein
MRVTVSFVDGRLEEFDSDRLTRPDPLPGRSVLSDLVLSLGDDGIWLELDYYDSQGVAEGEALRRRRGWRAQLATPKELGSVSRVDVDGAARWLRAGGGLVDVSRLDDVRAMLDDGPSDLPALSAWAYRTGLSIPEVAGDDPRDATERVCAWMGVPAGSLEFLSRVRATVSQTSDPGFGGASRGRSSRPWAGSRSPF